jgi:hypothetical protein
MEKSKLNREHDGRGDSVSTIPGPTVLGSLHRPLLLHKVGDLELANRVRRDGMSRTVRQLLPRFKNLPVNDNARAISI